jgi:hypothetical protein
LKQQKQTNKKSCKPKIMSARVARTTRGNQPDLPETKKLKVLQNKTIQQKAFAELLELRASNGGLIGYGDYKIILDKYVSKGFHCVTCRKLRYRLSLYDERISNG